MTKSRILVVDDERIVSLDIQGALKRLGYEIAGLASSGEEALGLASSARPDLVLMDVRLSGAMDGTEAARRIGAELDIPVVFLTAYSDEETMRRALSTAPFGYLLKPFDDRELLGAIELALTKHRAEADLRRARQAAEDADRAKTAFLATLSHELRTPMNGILGMAELLLMSGMDEEQRENVEHLKQSALGFVAVLNRLLEFSSLEAGTCELECTEFELTEFMVAAVAAHREHAAAKGLSFSLATLPAGAVIRAPADRLRQVLGHLLDNALRYTRTGGIEVEARLGPVAQGGEAELFVRVRDTGSGIPPEKLPMIFDSFTQGEDYLTRQGSGLGLGLAMCRLLVERMGGKIFAESEPARGSEFRFSLRVRAVAKEGEASLDGARILVVEDDLVNRLFLSKTLELSGSVLFQAETGEQALELLASTEVDAVVMDLQLPGIDGAEVTRLLRAGKAGADPATPVLALTAHARQEDRALCLDAGMDAVMSKPADIGKLQGMLRGLLARRGPSAQPAAPTGA